jgi:hypothetical protein
MTSGGRKSSLSSGGALRAEIAVKSVDGSLQNQVAIGTSLQMVLDFAFYGRG